MTRPFGQVEGSMPAMKIKDEQRKDGRLFSFLIPTDAVPEDLVMAPMGTKLMLAYARYSEEEKIPGSVNPQTQGAEKTSDQAPALPSRGQGEPAPKSEGERAVQRAGMLANDARFQLWASRHPLKNDEFDMPIDAAEFIRQRCGVLSRKEFLTQPAARQRFYSLVDAYESEMGLRAEQRGSWPESLPASHPHLES